MAARKDKAEEGRPFLHRGIAHRSFERRFELADHVLVKSAAYADGVLAIDLIREMPEALKPRRIPIAQASGEDVQRITDKPSRRAA